MKNEDRLPATPGVIPPIGWILVREANSDKVFWVNPKSLKESSPTSELSAEQLERIKRIASSLQEHDSTPVEQWILNMRKDRHPENEIKIWEQIIEVYQAELTDRPTAQYGERHLVYSVLLTASMLSKEMCNVENVLSLQPSVKSLPKLKQVIERYNLNRYS